MKKEHFLTPQDVFRTALKITRGNPKADKIRPTKDNRFLVVDLDCAWCSGPTFSEACFISKKEPNGDLWYCEKCGVVDEDGHPTDLRDESGKLIYGEEDPPPKSKKERKPSNEPTPF